MAPACLLVDGERALVIAAMDVTICSNIFSHIERIAQLRLEDDLDLPALAGDDRYHLKNILHFNRRGVIHHIRAGVMNHAPT